MSRNGSAEDSAEESLEDSAHDARDTPRGPTDGDPVDNGLRDAPLSGRWVPAIASASVPDGGAVEVLVEDQILAIFRVAGTLHALDGMCAHQGGPLAQGTIGRTSDGRGCVTCPWHGWQYELETGIQTINRQPLQRTYVVRETAGQVEVLI